MHEAAIRTLIHERYAAAHDARPAADYPTYLTVGVPEAPQAVVGFRTAGAAPLFLERYLDRPVETVLSERLGRPIPRSRIVELGDHASHRPTATVALWREAAVALAGQADFAVAVLTRQLRDDVRPAGPAADGPGRRRIARCSVASMPAGAGITTARRCCAPVRSTPAAPRSNAP